MLDWYNTYKALHIISFTAWMAGLFYLPRLYVYHCKVKSGSEADLLFQTMELRLLRIIMNPAMVLTFIFGVCMIVELGFVNIGKWFHIKALLLILLCIFHASLSVYRKAFASDANRKTEKFFRMINEIPTFLLIFIVLLAVFKPYS